MNKELNQFQKNFLLLIGSIGIVISLCSIYAGGSKFFGILMLLFASIFVFKGMTSKDTKESQK